MPKLPRYGDIKCDRTRDRTPLPAAVVSRTDQIPARRLGNGPRFGFHSKPTLFNRALRFGDITFFFCAAPQPTIQVCNLLRGVNDGRDSVPLFA
jgi:hypothetical protein